MQSALGRLRGEWAELSGAEFHVSAVARGALREEQPLEHDLIVFPSRLLGELCELHRLRPMRQSVLKSDLVAWNDITVNVRQGILNYGRRTMAMPLGCVTPLLEMASEPEAQSPGTWEELASWRLDPSASSDAELLAEFFSRAGCYGLSPSRESFFFDLPTLEPRLTAPFFVQALEEMVQRAHQGVETPIAKILFPGRSPSAQADRQDASSACVVFPLPGTRRVFDEIERAWMPVDSKPRTVILLGLRGSLIGVTTSTRNATSAFRLLEWLASDANAAQLSRASNSVANVRVSRGRTPDDWAGAGSPDLGNQCSRALADSLRRRHRLAVPSIPGVDLYLAAVAKAIYDATALEDSPADALQKATNDWEMITDSLGRDGQRLALERWLGITKYMPSDR